MRLDFSADLSSGCETFSVVSNPSYGQIVRRAHQLDEKLTSFSPPRDDDFGVVKFDESGKKRTSVLQMVILLSVWEKELRIKI